MKSFVAVLLSILALSSFGQHPDYWQLTEDEGLPSNVVYDIIQDSRGFMWIGTDRGLVKYNGQSVVTYTSTRQKSTAITNLNEDAFGRIWGVNFSQQVFYVESDSLLEIEIPSLDKVQGHVKTVIIGDFLYVYSYGHADRLNLKTMNWDVDFYSSNWPITSNGVDRRLLYTLAGEGDKYSLSFSEEVHHVENDERKHLVHIPKKPGYYRSCWFDGSKILMSHGFSDLLEFRSSTGDTASIPVSHPDHDSSTRMLVCGSDGSGNLWLCTSGGARILKSANAEFSDQLFFPELQVSRVIQDREGNLWFSTLQHGVKIIPSHRVTVFNQQNSELEFTEISSIGVDAEGEILVGSFDGLVHRVSRNGHIDGRIDLGFRKEINGFVNYMDQSWAYGEQMVSLSSGNKKRFDRPISIKQAESLSGNNLAFVSSEGFAATDFSGSTPQIPSRWNPKGSMEGRGVRIIYETGIRRFHPTKEDGVFYLSTTNGLFLYKDDEKVELLAPSGSSIYSLGMVQDEKGMLWVSTVSQGILAFQGQKLKQSIDRKIFGDAVQLSNIDVSSGKLWVASNEGLIRVDPTDTTFEKFNVSDGLPTNSINDLTVIGGYVWLATMKGLVKIPEDYSSINSRPPLLEFGGVSVNNLITEDLQGLDYRQNNVTFKLDPIALRSQGSAKIKYRLNGLSAVWQEVPIDENEIRFLALAPGDYAFEAKAINEDGYESELVVTELTIAPPFWQTWWFYLIAVLLLVGIVSGIFLFRMREIRKRDAVQHDLRVSELSALKAQMNPHFVFNALNSIQDYVLMNQTELANDYLGKFARLMRKTLDQSQMVTVTLSEELELLKLYLELEAIRFEEEFEYSIKVDSGLNTEKVEIPSMIVQPFVENAIKHGLLHKKEDRVLAVDFKMFSSVLECRIEDNGIGLEASRKMNESRAKTHRSFGTGAVKKRLALLNEGRKEQISVEMKDVTDPSKGITGTHVLLRIPILNEKDNA